MDVDYDFLVDQSVINRLKLYRENSKNDNRITQREINHNYSNLSVNFVSEYKNSNFIQYSHLYYIRLNDIRKELYQIAAMKWNGIKICKNILDVKGKVIYSFT
jgi:hypothetical protein